MKHNKKNIMWPEEIKSGKVTWQSNEFGDCYQSDHCVYGLYFEKHKPKFRQVKDEKNGKTIQSIKIKEGHWKVYISHIIPKYIMTVNKQRNYKYVQGERKCERKLSYNGRLEALNLHINGKFDECRRFIEHSLWTSIPNQISPTTLRFLIDDLS